MRGSRCARVLLLWTRSLEAGSTKGANMAATPSYPGNRPSGSTNDVRVYQTPKSPATTGTTGTTIAKKSTSTALWWVSSAVPPIAR